MSDDLGGKSTKDPTAFSRQVSAKAARKIKAQRHGKGRAQAYARPGAERQIGATLGFGGLRAIETVGIEAVGLAPVLLAAVQDP